MDDSLTISGQAEPAGVTTFEQEACVGTEVYGSMYKGSALTIPQKDIQNITDYFQRPRLFARGTIPFGTRGLVVGTNIQLSFFTTNFPQWTQRLSGVYAIRFTLMIRVQIAATAFHQGVVALAFQNQISNSTTGVFNRATNTAAVTNLPHVRCDIAENSMVELKIPFLWYLEYYPVTATGADASGLYGYLSLSALLPPISVTGMNPPTYEAYCYLDDLELYGADNNAPTSITLQGGKRVAVKEQEDAHVFSNAFAATSKAVSFVGKHIPLLSSIADTTSWALDTAAGIARFFGYARPLIQDPVVRVYNTQYAGEGNVDTMGVGFMLGPMQTNTLATDAHFSGNDVDEMALAFVLQQWAQICVGSLSTTDTHNKVIYACNVSPANFWFRIPGSAPYCNIPPPYSINVTNNSFFPSHLLFWASMFRQWRGTVIFRFTFAKTKFHGGRYMVSFNPSETPNVWSSSLSAQGPEVASTYVQPYGYSMIMDLKDSNVFDFSVPWLCAMPYLTFGGHTGSLSMVCIDPLQAASAIATTVQFMVEVKGGSDFELANFRGLMWYPNVAGTCLQSGKVITAMKDPSIYTVGEKITSAKQLISIPHYTSCAVAAIYNKVIWGFPWWYYRPLPSTSPMATSTVFSGLGRVGGAIAQCYVYARGSTDFHVYSIASDNIFLVAYHYGGDNAAANASASTMPYWGNSNSPKVIATNGSPLHVRMPGYQTICRLPTWALSGTQWTFDLSSTPAVPQPGAGPFFANTWVPSLPRIGINNASSNATVVITSTAAGDDAMLGVYIGPVPLAVPQSTNANTLDPDWSIVPAGGVT